METNPTAGLSPAGELLPDIGLGVIGMGGFGLFAVQQFMQTPNVKLVAIAGSKREEAKAAARRFGAEHLDSLDELLSHPDINLIYIATPPFLHFEQAMRALDAGKHVICEKPLAMNPEQGRLMLEKAAQKGLLMVTNLMQRYNPMFERVKRLIDLNLLGEVLHGYFENYAGDEGLSPEHWFWDRSKSGGIFVEHGVHFFDMFSGWLGQGNVLSAQVTKRPNSADIEDQVSCTVAYGDEQTGLKTVNFYHGFTQTGRMDRQEMRILFERGDITLYEWVPTRLVLRAVVDEETTRELMTLFPGAQLNVTANFGGKDRVLRGRHKEFEAYQQIELRYGFGDDKLHLYSELLRLMFRDQVSAVYFPDTHRKITNENGLDSLIVAAEADRLARRDFMV
ncbi:gfo/Idh/MocA family oxidoreductase [Rudanella paleaurantiibacter]|uniref:Gfo/Idh/MocA family oxidoreductase n=1 Tax=Rudanella paleaurantiibacter TaxID=2614655 RepID=A0A7J5U2P0_9BACT|nr:Gfo/Idh/MocA family oxidoreductase [Rudanella paleaurantiibacter]KAB7731960.1 gfo/Idh/MocA family oxidoreductase [Rudanella paleaurantiibacter]